MGLVWACSALTLLGKLEIEQNSMNHQSVRQACKAGAKVHESSFVKILLSGPKRNTWGDEHSGTAANVQGCGGVQVPPTKAFRPIGLIRHNGCPISFR